MSKKLRRVLLVLVPGMTCFAICAQTSKGAGTKPDFSKEAFVIEQDSTRVSFENDGTGIRETESRIHIQSDAGVQQWGILSFPYESSTQTVDIEYVRVEKPDKTVILTPLDGVQDMASEVTRAAPLYSDLKEKHLAVKGLSQGDILEFKATWRTTHPLAPGQFWFAFNFSHDNISLQQRLEIRFPRERNVKWKSTGPQPVITEVGGSRIFGWTSAQLEHKTSEEEKKEKTETTRQAIWGQLPPPDLLISSFQSWEEVGRWYGGLQAERVKPSPEVRAKATEVTKSATDESARIRAIYSYVSTQFRYIGIDFGIGRYQPHTAAEVLANQYGDCKDKHTLLASLLEASGVSAYPALISVGHAIDPDVPSPGQFDHVISVVSQGPSLTWLDTTPEVAPFGYLLSTLRSKPALVILDGKPASLITTPEDGPSKSVQSFHIKAKLDDSGKLEGRIERSMEGNDVEVLLRRAFRSVPLPNWKDLIQRISYASGYAGDVSDVTAGSPDKIEEPLQFAYNYARKDYPDWSNRRIDPPLPPIVMPEALEDDATAPHNIWLGSPDEIDSLSELELPKGYTPELPKNVDLSLSFGEYHCRSSFKDGILTTDRRLIMKGRELAVSDYESYKKFSKMVTDDHDSYIPLYAGHKPAIPEGSHMEQITSLPGSTNPEAEDAFEDMANAHDPAGAVASIQRAVELDPKFTRGWLTLGEMFTVLRQPDSALRAYRKAVEGDPQQPLAYKVLASALMKMGASEEALKVWQELTKLSPEDAAGPSGEGTALMALKRYRDAVAKFDEAAKLEPQRASSHGQLGSAYLEAGDDEKALSSYQKALSLDGSPERYNDVAYSLADAGKQLPTAMEFAEKAVMEEEESTQKIELSKVAVPDLQLMMSLAAAWDTLGWVQFRQGKLDAAAKSINASWLLSQRPVVAGHLGQVYERQHKLAAAARMYLLALAATSGRPNDAGEIKEIRGRLQQLTVRLGTRNLPSVDGGAELSRMRIAKVERFAQGTSSAEVFLLLVWDPKESAFQAQDWRFVSGSEALKPTAQVLRSIRFELSAPDTTPVRLLRRGILGCYQYTGCSLAMFEPDLVRSVE